MQFGRTPFFLILRSQIKNQVFLVYTIIMRVIVFLLLRESLAGNCTGRQICSKTRKLKGIPSEERELLELLGSTPTPVLDALDAVKMDSNGVDLSISPPAPSTASLDTGSSNSTGEHVSIPRPAFTIPPYGKVTHFIWNNMKVETTLSSVNHVLISNIDSPGDVKQGILEMRTDCLDNHVVDRMAVISSALENAGVSLGHHFHTSGVFVGHDELLNCDRERKAIVWRHYTGMSLNELRQSSAGRQVGIRTSFRVVLKLAEAIRRMHTTNVCHGSLSPENIMMLTDSNSSFGFRLIISDLHKARILSGMGLLNPPEVVADIRSIFQILIDIHPPIYDMYNTHDMAIRGGKEIAILKSLISLRMFTLGAAGNLPIAYDTIEEHLKKLILLI